MNRGSDLILEVLKYNTIILHEYTFTKHKTFNFNLVLFIYTLDLGPCLSCSLTETPTVLLAN